jgi:hypothetical protein
VDFETANTEYLRLKAAYEANEIDAAQFEEAVYGLSLLDSEGQLWQIGLSSGAWYRKEGDTWIEDSPPVGTASLQAALPASVPASSTAQPMTPKLFLNLPVWAWTLLALSGMVTWLGLFALVTFYYINQRPAPVAVSRTLVVYGIETPNFTPTPTHTAFARVTETMMVEETPVPEETEESFPTITLEPTISVTPQPTRSGNLLPVTVWKQLSGSNFDRIENVRGEWRQTFDDSKEYELGDYQFVNYRGLNSAIFKYFSEFTDIIMETSEEELDLRDIEIEEMIAFRSGNDAGYLDIMCRFSDWIFTYTFTINSRDWALIKYDDDQETQLANGQLPSGFRAGEWGRVRMRCVGDTISVWLNSTLLVSVRDTTFPTGQWAITLYLNEGFSEADIYLNSHRVYYQRNEVPLLGDMIQVGDVFVTLDSGWRREGARYSLGVWFENRANETVNISADQIFLLRADGRRIPVDANPSEGNAFQFPFSLREGMRTGNMYFSGITADDIDWGLQLVIDLTAAGLNEISFQLPVE